MFWLEAEIWCVPTGGLSSCMTMGRRQGDRVVEGIVPLRNLIRKRIHF